MWWCRRSDAAAQQAGILPAAAAAGGASSGQQQAGSRNVKAAAAGAGGASGSGKKPKVSLCCKRWWFGPAVSCCCLCMCVPQRCDGVGLCAQRGLAGRRLHSGTQILLAFRLHRPLAHTSVHARVLQVGIIMGSNSDLPTMKAAEDILQEFGVPCELTIVSAHRTPDRMMTYARTAHERGLQVSR